MTAHEQLPVDILVVGGGPAGLATAYHLKKLLAAENDRRKSTGQETLSPEIAVIEKGSEIGAHSLSGAILDPEPLARMIPDYLQRGFPVEYIVEEEKLLYLTRSRKVVLPFIPPGFHNQGLSIISLSKFCRWLGKQVEEEGVNLFTGFAGKETLWEEQQIVGVRTGDKGIDAKSQPKANFEPGVDIRAKLTIFAEGVRGYLSKQLAKTSPSTTDHNPPLFETGVKEIYRLPAGKIKHGFIYHTFGYPLSRDTSGGAFLYSMKNDLLVIGLVVSLDYRDSLLDPHAELQKLKQHPFLQDLLAGAEPVYYGGKAINAGGYYSLPPLVAPGALLVGECAGLLNAQRLKGIHLAIASGMLAAETAFASLLKNDFSHAALSAYQQKIEKGEVFSELKKVRNFHQALGLGMPCALFHLAAQNITGGRGFVDPMFAEEDRHTLDPLPATISMPPKPTYDGKLTLNKLDDVYNSGTKHDEDQPSHLQIGDLKTCYEKCVDNYAYPCTRFCPAQVYEMLKDETTNHWRLQINFTNCLHCQTCDIKCPYDNIRWTPPEGGQGPNYSEM